MVSIPPPERTAYIHCYGIMEKGNVIGLKIVWADFERVFGTWSERDEDYIIDANHLAYLNSFPLIAYALGVFGATFIGEKFGRRIVFFGMNCICMAGVIICYC